MSLLHAERRLQLGLHVGHELGEPALEPPAEDVGDRQRPVAGARACGRLQPTRSVGATGETSARARRGSSSARNSSRPRSSAAASGRCRCGPSSGLTAGSAPRKFGVDADDLAADDRVVQRDVVPAEAPAPGSVPARLAEDRDVVEQRVATALAAEVDRPAFELIQDVVEPHDQGDGHVAGRGQAGRDQPMDVAMLDRAHRGERQAAVIGRRVVPEAALRLVRKRPARDPALRLIHDSISVAAASAMRPATIDVIAPSAPCSANRSSGSPGTQACRLGSRGRGARARISPRWLVLSLVGRDLPPPCFAQTRTPDIPCSVSSARPNRGRAHAPDRAHVRATPPCNGQARAIAPHPHHPTLRSAGPPRTAPAPPVGPRQRAGCTIEG